MSTETRNRAPIHPAPAEDAVGNHRNNGAWSPGGVRIDAPSERLRRRFFIAIVLMFAHKVECWWTDEWLESPFFQRLVHATRWAGMDPDAMLGEAMFLTFVFWLFAGLLMGWLVLRGGAWPTVALGTWGLTFVLEWHHLVRAALAGTYYSGLVTASFYVAFGVAWYLPELIRHVHVLPGRQAGSA